MKMYFLCCLFLFSLSNYSMDRHKKDICKIGMDFKSYDTIKISLDEQNIDAKQLSECTEQQKESCLHECNELKIYLAKENQSEVERDRIKRFTENHRIALIALRNQGRDCITQLNRILFLKKV